MLGALWREKQRPAVAGMLCGKKHGQDVLAGLHTIHERSKSRCAYFLECAALQALACHDLKVSNHFGRDTDADDVGIISNQGLVERWGRNRPAAPGAVRHSSSRPRSANAASDLRRRSTSRKVGRA